MFGDPTGGEFFERGEKPDEPVQAASESFEGVVDRVVYQNKENGFTVARFTDLRTDERFPIVGNFFLDLNEGTPVTIYGSWGMHPRFGRQFKVERYENNLPRTTVGIVRYLASFIKGVGPVMAKRIVDHFGEETADIIEKTPERLNEVEGIGRRKAQQIIKSWKEHSRIKSVMMFLQSHNIGPGIAMKIFSNYGDASVQVLKENPYILATEIYGIGFRTADRIAMNLGMEKESPVRLEAGVCYTLETAGNDGHIYLLTDELIKKTAEMLEGSESKVEEALGRLLALGERVIAENDRMYLPQYHYAEVMIARRLARIIKHPSDRLFRLDQDERQIRQAEKALGFKLSNQQIGVADELSNSKIVILTGGPGTGKTISTRLVIHLFESNGYRVLLAAPTGRAAKRMSEATGRPARTIHRLLEYNPKTNSFSRNEENPLECDLLVVDEMSMVDVMLMYHLVKAVKYGTRLLLAGDVDQLPSVGPGNVLRDLIDSLVIPTIRLDVIFRQETGSTIVGNAHLINNGEMPVMAGDKSGNFFFSQQDDPEKALEVIVRMCAERLPRLFNVNPVEDIQVISPMYRGVLGVDNLNKVLQEKLNPGKDLLCGTKNFRIGDRVMQIKNNYDKDAFNGDVGFIRTVDLQEGKLAVGYPDHTVEYDFKEADQIVLAYAITVHKSQGSEYPVVVMPASTHHYTMLQRNLLYTAVTRAERIVVLVGTKKAIAIAVKNNKIEKRYTSLNERLIQEMKQQSLSKNSGGVSGDGGPEIARNTGLPGVQGTGDVRPAE
jgi:exodeoxyribonuclease V alpha subunit